MREQVAKALNNKDAVRRYLAYVVESNIAHYDEIIERPDNDDSPDRREQVAWALSNKGEAFGKQGKTKEAIALFDEVIRRFGNDDSPEVREQVAEAKNLRKRLLGQ